MGSPAARRTLCDSHCGSIAPKKNRRIVKKRSADCGSRVASCVPTVLTVPFDGLHGVVGRFEM